MDSVFYGDKDGAFFSYEDINKCRVLKKCVYADSVNDLVKAKEFVIPPLKHGEKRILSADVALLAGKKNDAASLFINSCIPNKKQKYTGNLIYTENHEGLRTDDLALVIRRLYEQFHCTDIAIDVSGLGIGVYDALANDIYDPTNGKTYCALSCCNNKDYAERCKDKEAPKVIWAIKATQAFNTSIYLALREAFKQGKINLLVGEYDAEEMLKDIRGYSKMDTILKAKLALPYIHTTLLMHELIELEYKTVGTDIKVYEKSGMRKDRVSSVAYNYFVQQELERKLRKPRNNAEEIFKIPFRQPIMKKR